MSGPGEWTWFIWAKTYSVTSACAWISACRAWPGRVPTPAIRWPIQLFLALNIFEAVAKDVSSGNWMNAVAGTLLVVTMAWPPDLAIDSNERRDLLFPIGGAWVLAYTLWNATFLSCNWSALALGQHLSVLGAAVMLGFVHGWDRWLQARAYTLGLHLLVYDTVFFRMREAFDTTAFYSQQTSHRLQIVTLTIVAVSVALTVCRRRSARIT